MAWHTGTNIRSGIVKGRGLAFRMFKGNCAGRMLTGAVQPFSAIYRLTTRLMYVFTFSKQEGLLDPIFSWHLGPCPMSEHCVWWLVAASSAIIKGISYRIIITIYHISYVTSCHIIPPSHSKGLFEHSACIDPRISARWAMWIPPAPRASQPPCSRAPGRRCVRWRGSSSRRAVESRWWSAQAPRPWTWRFLVDHGLMGWTSSNFWVQSDALQRTVIWRCKDLRYYGLIWSHVFDGRGCCSATWAKATTEPADCHTWPSPTVDAQRLLQLAGMLPSDNSKQNIHVWNLVVYVNSSDCKPPRTSPKSPKIQNCWWVDATYHLVPPPSPKYSKINPYHPNNP